MVIIISLKSLYVRGLHIKRSRILTHGFGWNLKIWEELEEFWKIWVVKVKNWTLVIGGDKK